ncbi:hypothetical protein CEY09_30885 [Achromobacter marplatensis]|uniref:Cyanophage baseplate Pam3 plug gp18 domain-containing protein n=1 Tax=Achromobacter marplatensis TaxID=470868 RepID=A0ABX9FYH8_9BURK|nr:hypothetical protein [Achromobacter marplatensis]OWT54872.1 hypothetical protein CEY09_30885 [Achromobacter marplatensis]RBP10450.1 hypothetical protein DFP87_12714 [Achromobacter marplatensis]CAB3715263.1 hypothetical protein LMG26219_06174 [Achromobacter marplatensis]
MRKIPLRPVPSQSFSVVLAGQSCQVNVYEKSTGMYLDLFVSHQPIVTTALCHDRVRLVRERYRGFVGDLTFIDTRGYADPEYTGLGERFVLAYLEANEL